MLNHFTVCSFCEFCNFPVACTACPELALLQWSEVTDDLLGQAKRPFAEFICSARNIYKKFDWRVCRLG